VLPTGSRLRERIDRALLGAIQSPWWQQAQFSYLGKR
jgi:hypothetical protein